MTNDDTIGFSLRLASGVTHTYCTYEDAISAVRSIWSAPAIGHPGDCSEGGERTLVWPSEELAEDDDGSRACASIVRLHAPLHAPEVRS